MLENKLDDLIRFVHSNGIKCAYAPWSDKIYDIEFVNMDSDELIEFVKIRSEKIYVSKIDYDSLLISKDLIDAVIKSKEDKDAVEGWIEAPVDLYNKNISLFKLEDNNNGMVLFSEIKNKMVGCVIGSDILIKNPMKKLSEILNEMIVNRLLNVIERFKN